MTVRTTDVADAAHADREKRLVAASSVAAALLLTGMKIAVGFSTGSIGILSEAAHSGLDLVAAAVTLWAVRSSAKPADRDHPYGHGKIENFSALFETGLLLATCAWIAYETVKRPYAICGICFWEDDELQLEYATTLAGGANKPTLMNAQHDFAQFGACEPEMVAHVRRPGPCDKRDPTWRPIDQQRDHFERWGAPERRRPPTRGEALYYWRATFWRLRS